MTSSQEEGHPGRQSDVSLGSEKEGCLNPPSQGEETVTKGCVLLVLEKGHYPPRTPGRSSAPRSAYGLAKAVTLMGVAGNVGLWQLHNGMRAISRPCSGKLWPRGGCGVGNDRITHAVAPTTRQTTAKTVWENRSG